MNKPTEVAVLEIGSDGDTAAADAVALSDVDIVPTEVFEVAMLGTVVVLGAGGLNKVRPFTRELDNRGVLDEMPADVVARGCKEFSPT